MYQPKYVFETDITGDKTFHYADSIKELVKVARKLKKKTKPYIARKRGEKNIGFETIDAGVTFCLRNKGWKLRGAGMQIYPTPYY